MNDKHKYEPLTKIVVKAKCGAKPKYTTGHVIITRSVPAGLIPELDAWLIEAKKRHEIPVKQVNTPEDF